MQTENTPRNIEPITQSADLAKGVDIIAAAATLRYGDEILGVRDTRGEISGDMPVADVYKQTKIKSSNLSEAGMQLKDETANNILVLDNLAETDPEEHGLIDREVTLELQKLEDALAASRAAAESIEVARTPKEEAKVTQGITATQGQELTPQADKKVRGSRLPMMSSADMIKILTKRGFVETREQTGSHATYQDADGHITTVPIHSKDLGEGLRDTILDQAGIADPTKKVKKTV